MPMKPIRCGFKMYAVCDAHNGYMLNFHMNTPPAAGQPKHTVTSIVMRCIEPYTGRNHHLYLDRYFPTADLMSTLRDQNTGVVGSYNTVRTGWPRQFRVHQRPAPPKVSRIRQSPRGTAVMLQKDGQLACLWKDNKIVANMSTVHSSPVTATDISLRREKGKRRRIEVSCPRQIIDYGKYMGGVDRNDQLRSYYSCNRMTKKWWKKLVFFYLDVAVVNGYLMYKECCNLPQRKQVSHKVFQVKLVQELVRGYTCRKRVQQPRPLDVAEDNNRGHQLMKRAGRAKACRNCLLNRRRTPSNRAVESTWWCEPCGVNLCRSGCFVPWHAAQ